MENLFFPIHFHFHSKFEEIEHFIDYGKFEMWPTLYYVNSRYFQHFLFYFRTLGFGIRIRAYLFSIHT